MKGHPSIIRKTLDGKKVMMIISRITAMFMTRRSFLNRIVIIQDILCELSYIIHDREKRDTVRTARRK